MARKKYHQSKKDRRDESRGMRRAMESKRHESDSQIYEDYSAPANLPQEVIHEYYPRTMYGMEDGYLGDSLRGVDMQMDDDVKGMRRHRSKSKY